MQTELTPRQQQLLDYLETRISTKGKAPSLREAADAMGVSHTAVAQSLRALEEKEYVKRDGRYSRTIYLLNRASRPAGVQRWREVPVIGRVTAGLPMYAQQEWDGSLVVDAERYPGKNLFALKIQGDSMRDAGILNNDLAICEPRQYAENGEIVVALIHGEEATVKRFYLRKDHIELRPANPDFKPVRYGFSDILVQGKLIGIQRVLGAVPKMR
ncbi:MAG: transcriptional repressor LexA [Desulfobacteraceae bacterium]|nr:transcriptional repressor LexA [Desulfobacteraceae bacterium]